ncbi:hypothetical protein SUDANB95_06932 [Actinosynnema sp. ALI-1.44]
MVHGDNTHITVVNVSSDAGRVVVSGAYGSAIGSQTVLGDRNTATGDGSPPANGERDTWWTRLRKRGVLVALFTVLGGAAGVLAVVLNLPDL